MNEKLMALFVRRAPPQCERCAGSGMVTMQGREWTPRVCWCGACNGTGIQREARLLSFRLSAPSHTTNKEKD